MGDHKHKKSSKRDHKESSSSRDHKKHKKSSKKEKEIDYSDPSLWVEAGTNVAEITPAEHLRNHQKASEAREQELDADSTLPQEHDARHGWMLDGGMDFGAMGTARIKEEDKPKPNPDFVSITQKVPFIFFFLTKTNIFCSLW